MTNASGLPVTLNESTRPFHVPSNALLASAAAGISSSTEIKILMKLPLLVCGQRVCATPREPISVFPRPGFTNSQVRDSGAARLQDFRQDVGAIIAAGQVRVARAVEVRHAERAVVITALQDELDGLAGLVRRGNGRIEHLGRVLVTVHGDELHAG